MHRLTAKERKEIESAFESIFSDETKAKHFEEVAKTHEEEEQASMERKAKTNELVDGLFRGENGGDNDSPEET